MGVSCGLALAGIDLPDWAADWAYVRRVLGLFDPEGEDGGGLERSGLSIPQVGRASPQLRDWYEFDWYEFD